MVADYYEMLGIRPDADRASIEEALARCQPKWSAGARNPKHRHTFQSYLDQIPAIRAALLGDLATRSGYDAELAAQRRLQLDRKLDELQRLIRLRSAKGGLTVSDRDRLKAEAQRLGVPDDAFARLLEPIPPLPERPPEPIESVDPPADVIDSATRGQIRRTLDHLRRLDLYDALGLQRDAPQSEILNRADEERQRWRQKSRVSAEMTAWLEVIAYAQSHLGTPEARSRYDRTLEREAEDRFRMAIRFCLDGESRIASGTRSALLDEAASLGIAPDRALRLIRRSCHELGIVGDQAVPSDPSPSSPMRLLRCRSCQGVTELTESGRNTRSCRHCGDSLRWECPICHRDHWVDEPRCPCGFRLELREPMLQHFEAAQRAHKARDYASALAHLHRIQEFAPDHPGTRKAVEKVKERLAQIEQTRSTFEQDLARRHLVAAQIALRKWAALVDPTDPEVRSAFAEVNRGLREARSLTARGVSLIGTDPNQARLLLQRALQWSVDLTEAAEALRRCPPDPPFELRAEVEQDAVMLRWSPPATDGLGPVSFRVVRKSRGIPHSPDDGTRITETRATQCRDPNASPGEVVGYAVFSHRDGIHSVVPSGVGPVLILADVIDVRVEARSGEVDLAWRLPVGASEVRVVRKTGSPPAHPDDGTPIDALPEGTCDRNLTDDTVYHYVIYAVYRTPEGKPRLSKGILLAAMPHPPLAVVEALRLEPMPDGAGVRVSWAPLERGQVRILRTDRPPAVLEGQRVPTSTAEGLEGYRLPMAGPDHAIDRKPPASGLCYYVPLTSWGGMCTVGRPIAYTHLPDPSDLRAVRIGSSGRVHLRWRWSPSSNQTLIACKSGSPPLGPDDPETLRVFVTELEYSRSGYASIDLPPGEIDPYHITLYSVSEIDGQQLVSPGLEPTARTIVPGPVPEISLSYTIRRPRLASRSWTLTLKTEPPGAPIPPLVLVGHPRTVPLSADDGEILSEFPSSRGGDSFRFIPDGQVQSCRLRLFVHPTAPADEISPIRLRHPEAERTRV
ncbi:hypothetical protein [Tautonia rosea]|uniref:hypothetical protein n=1 Tax=Tautonia rosea TaxID=2728037 RepID=UPI001473106B|nr:hypothetical protein [Tautonia rosea]